MDEVFWLVPGRLGGRPGPDRSPWDLEAMKRAGVGAVLSVNDGSFCYPEDFASAGIVYACVPLTDNAPPQPGDDEVCLPLLEAAYDFVDGELERGRSVVVHCTSGKDRTGLFLCYWLVRVRRLAPAAAVAEVRAVRPIALSAPGWHDFALDLLGRVAAR